MKTEWDEISDLMNEVAALLGEASHTLDPNKFPNDITERGTLGKFGIYVGSVSIGPESKYMMDVN